MVDGVRVDMRHVAQRADRLQHRISLHCRDSSNRRQPPAVEIEDHERRLFVPHRLQDVLLRPLEVDIHAQPFGGRRDLDREDQVIHYAHDHIDRIVAA